MQVLDIVDQARNQIARVTYSSEEGLSVQIINPAFKDELEAFLGQAETEGVKLTTGRAMEKENEVTLFTEQRLVKSDNKLFLPALPDSLRKQEMVGQRVFGLLKEVEATK